MAGDDMATKRGLEIKTASIEIKVVRVDGHKMTKATFRQIPESNFIDQKTPIIPSVESVMGWVSDDGYYLLYSDRCVPRKYFIFDRLFVDLGMCRFLPRPYPPRIPEEKLDRLYDNARAGQPCGGYSAEELNRWLGEWHLIRRINEGVVSGDVVLAIDHIRKTYDQIYIAT